MSTYQEPIHEESYNTVCSATSLGNTVVGILFEKTGAEIKAAAQARLDALNTESDRLASMLEPLRAFILDKESHLSKVRDIEIQRRAERTKALAKPREVIRKAKTELDDAEHKVDSETRLLLAKEEADFKSGWDQFSQNEALLELALHAEELETPDARGVRSSTSSRSAHPTPTATPTLTATGTSAYYSDCSEWSPTVSSVLQGALDEHKDLAKRVADRLRKLDKERRVLLMVAKHINSSRSYKLDMSKLSAFGFEDINTDAPAGA